LIARRPLAAEVGPIHDIFIRKIKWHRPLSWHPSSIPAPIELTGIVVIVVANLFLVLREQLAGISMKFLHNRG
jgi:hypothetical protein